jgi:hypothetical protein
MNWDGFRMITGRYNTLLQLRGNESERASFADSWHKAAQDTLDKFRQLRPVSLDLFRIRLGVTTFHQNTGPRGAAKNARHCTGRPFEVSVTRHGNGNREAIIPLKSAPSPVQASSRAPTIHNYERLKRLAVSV